MSKDNPLFSGHLVHLHAIQRILPEATVLPLADMKEIAKGRIAQELGEFLTKQFLVVEGKPNGEIHLSVKLTVLVSQVPPGLAHTTIVFKEVPKP